MEPVFTRMKLKVTVLLLITIRLQTEAMKVTSEGPQTIHKAQGQLVNLGCTYTPGAQETGELDIEWANLSPDMTQKDKQLLTYSEGQTHKYADSSLANRLTFITDPSKGDASISISNLRTSDTGTYQCKVKKKPGVDTRKVTLVVMVPPSAPKCWVKDGEEKYSPVSLLCKSYHGSEQLSYVWRRENGALPADATQDQVSGELLIKNHTDSNVGSYVCEAKNAVGKAQCKYSLRAYNPTNRAGVIAGAVIGALLLLLLLLLLIWLIVCCCHKRRYEKEVANEIREDVQAPESRPVSRQSSRPSSLRSVLGYRTHGVHYSSVRKQLPSVGEAGANGPPPAGGKSSLKYDHQYGYPV